MSCTCIKVTLNTSNYITNTPSGSITETVTSVDYTQTVDNEYILVDASAGAVAITLLSPSSTQRATIIKTSNTGGDVIITPNTGLIQGSSSVTLLSNDYASITGYSSASAWWIK